MRATLGLVARDALWLVVAVIMETVPPVRDARIIKCYGIFKSLS